MKEIWKDIEGYNGMYKISNYGNVINFIRNKPLKNIIKNTGYIEFTLYKNGAPSYHRAHKLVALHFIPNPNNYNIINHINGNKADNYYENLEWCTSSHNTQHAYKNGLMEGKKGEDNINALLKENEVIDIYTNKDNMEIIELANLYNISTSLVGFIWNGKRWNYLTRDIKIFNRKFSDSAPFKFVKGVSPDGEIFYVKGFKELEKKDKNLKSRIKMIDCAKGLINNYKGWIFEYCSYEEYKNNIKD